MTEDFEKVILSFIDRMEQPGVDVAVGKLSTVLTGNYQLVMNTLNESMLEFMKQYVSVFNIKLSNYKPQ